MDRDRKLDLEHWLAPFSAALGHKTKARMCPSYVAGLIGPGDRKSVQPMAARDGSASYDRLHHFINSGVWDAADKLVGGDDAWLIVDDTALYQRSLIRTHGPFSSSDGYDAPRLVLKLSPRMTAMIDDVVVGFENAV